MTSIIIGGNAPGITERDENLSEQRQRIGIFAGGKGCHIPNYSVAGNENGRSDHSTALSLFGGNLGKKGGSNQALDQLLERLCRGHGVAQDPFEHAPLLVNSRVARVGINVP